MKQSGTRVIGMIGGVSWESSALLYRLINQEVRRRRGALANARSLLLTVDFEEIVALQHSGDGGDWVSIAALLTEHARTLEIAGADCVMLCANALHKVAVEVQASVGIPLLHIGDAAGRAVAEAGLKCVGLLGTRTTMEQPFLRNYLLEKHGIETVVPEAEDRAAVQKVIFEELAQGRVLAASRDRVVAVMERLRENGAQGAVLACTELPLLFPETTEAGGLPLFDTTALFAKYAVDWSLAE